MNARQAAAALTVTALVLGLVSCSSRPDVVPLPDGIVMYLDQSRVERKGREVFLRVQNNTQDDVTIEKFTMTSDRLETVQWSGSDEIAASSETDLEFDMPRGQCGSGFDISVQLTYRVDGSLRQSEGPAADRYGNLALFADRDCAELTLREAASIEIGEVRVDGVGPDSVLSLPVTMTPTGQRSDVSFAGFESTVIFRQAPGSPTDVDMPLVAGAPPATVVMKVVPARCDAHALADDKVGTLFGVVVKAKGLPEMSSFYLPLKPAQRSLFFDFYLSHCGL